MYTIMITSLSNPRMHARISENNLKLKILHIGITNCTTQMWFLLLEVMRLLVYKSKQGTA
jgi:hypothetical protein